MQLSPNLAGAGLGLVAFGCYSAYDISAKFLGAGYHPVQIIAAAGLLIMPMLLLRVLLDRGTGPLWPVRPGLMALRASATVANFICGVWALTMLPLAEAYVIFFSMPLLIAVLAVPFLGERIDPVRGIAVLAGLAGVVIALDPVATPPGAGHALALAGALVGAMNYIILRKTGAVERGVVQMVWPMLVLFVVAAAAMPFVYEPMPLRDVGISAFMALALLAGLSAIIVAYRLAPAIIVAPMQYSQILWAALFGVLLFQEPMAARTLVGALVIAAAGFVVVLRQDRAERPEG